MVEGLTKAQHPKFLIKVELHILLFYLSALLSKYQTMDFRNILDLSYHRNNTPL